MRHIIAPPGHSGAGRCLFGNCLVVVRIVIAATAAKA